MSPDPTKIAAKVVHVAPNIIRNSGFKDGKTSPRKVNILSRSSSSSASTINVDSSTDTQTAKPRAEVIPEVKYEAPVGKVTSKLEAQLRGEIKKGKEIKVKGS